MITRKPKFNYLLAVIIFGFIFAFSGFQVYAEGDFVDGACAVPIVSNLHKYSSGDEVVALQKILHVKATGFFGSTTYDAVVGFQNKYKQEILQPLGLSEGTGFVGPYTRAKLSELCGAVVTESPLVSNTVSDMESLASSDFWKLFKDTYFHEANIWFFIAFLILIVFGINFTLWGIIGFIRLVYDFFNKGKYKPHPVTGDSIREGEVAVIIPAHNEELVIADTLNSILTLIKKENVFVVSDGSKDATANIARSFNVNVLENEVGSGKAGALDKGIQHFDLINRFKAVILLDADTRLKHTYLKSALPFFNDPEIVAVAGYAATIWNPKKMNWNQLLFVSHRDRIYFLTQRFLKFGQTWKYTNVTPIVPGFASIYRTSIINKIDMNPPGLVIEDFNMTFEIHHKKLGKVAHHPKVVGYTQDPDNAQDYFKQVKRWQLGFWQTIRLHGFWTSKFWIALFLQLTEVLLESIVFLLLPFVLFFCSIALLVNEILLPDILSLFMGVRFMNFYYLLWVYALGIWIADYVVTIFVALAHKRRHYLLVGFAFPAIRFFDSIAFISGIFKAFVVKSTGKWVSPTRRTN